MKRQKEIGNCFLKFKLEIHAAEDSPFLNDLSDVLDIRNWNPSAFDPKGEDNEKDELMTKGLNTMIEKLKNSLKFYEDLNSEKVQSETKKILRLIYENERKHEI